MGDDVRFLQGIAYLVDKIGQKKLSVDPKL